MHPRRRFLKLYFLAPAVLVLFLARDARAGALSPEEAKEAQALRESKCAKCHKLYDPHDYDDEKWDTALKKMQKKAHLSEKQYDLLCRYFRSLKKNS